LPEALKKEIDENRATTISQGLSEERIAPTRNERAMTQPEPFQGDGALADFRVRGRSPRDVWNESWNIVNLANPA
jgi:hypothetical protein